MSKLPEEELKDLASHLSCPKGDKGKEVANQMHKTNQNMTYKTIDHLNLEKDDLILEIGMGNASHLPYIFDEVDVKYFGIDISETMVEESIRINVGYIKQNKAQFQVTSDRVIPFDKEVFTKVFSVNTIYFWKEPENYLQKIKNVLKKDGIFITAFIPEEIMKNISFSKFGFNHYSKDNVEQLFKKTFGNVSSYTYSETVVSNSGEQIKREFCVILSKKSTF